MENKDKKKRSIWFRIRAWWYVKVNDWPAYRITYIDGQRTHLLHYREAKSISEVFHGRLYVDWEAMYNWMDSWND